MVQYCINHPTQPARAKCKICGSPLCQDCKLIKPGGIFCSEKCVNEYQRIHEGVVQNEEMQKSVRKKWVFLRKLVSLVYLIILIGLIYFILKYLGIDLLKFIPR